MANNNGRKNGNGRNGKNGNGNGRNGKNGSKGNGRSLLDKAADAFGGLTGRAVAGKRKHAADIDEYSK